jgi:hypothetical protein
MEKGVQEKHRLPLLGGQWKLEFGCRGGGGAVLDGLSGSASAGAKVGVGCGMAGESGSFVSGRIEKIKTSKRRVNCVLLKEMNNTVCQPQHDDIGTATVVENYTHFEHIIDWGKCMNSSVRGGGAVQRFSQTAKLQPHTLSEWNNETELSFREAVADRIDLFGVTAGIYSSYCILHTAYSYSYCILHTAYSYSYCIQHTAYCILHIHTAYSYCILHTHTHTAYCIQHAAYSYSYHTHTPYSYCILHTHTHTAASVEINKLQEVLSADAVLVTFTVPRECWL